ncbi:MAG: polyprenyl synthetase family protein [Desulfobacterales bacterium]|nr:polyprenyl synthetase family protein [Desulfobacterales bacterium]
MLSNAIYADHAGSALETDSALDGDCSEGSAGLKFLSAAAGRSGAVHELIKRYISSSGSISEAAEYHLASGGKMFRPQFVLSIAMALGVKETTAISIAAACELLHNASLVHDDLQDKDETRRGQLAVWKAFGPETAINLGDYFIAGTFQALAEIDESPDLRVKLTRLFAETTRQVISGQSEELAGSRNLTLTEQDYENNARLKSGMLLALPVAATMIAGGVSSAQVASASSAMQWLGVAYQIQDDLVDLFGLKDGRPAGVDLREGRVNLPVIYYHETLENDPLKGAFASFFKSDISTTSEIDFWACRIRGSEAIDRSIARMNAAVDKADARIGELRSRLQSIISVGRSRMLKYVDAILKERAKAQKRMLMSG